MRTQEEETELVTRGPRLGDPTYMSDLEASKSQTESRARVSRVGGGESGELGFQGYTAAVRENDNVQETGSGDGHTVT